MAAHQDTGKTTIAEAMMFASGAINRMGKVQDGNTVMDSAPDEIERKITIQASTAFCEYKGTKINIVDTPGYEDFVGEVLCALDIVDGGVIVLRADGGVEVGTEKVWNHMMELGLPRIFCVNKMDKEHASFADCLEQMRNVFGNKVLPMQLPVGEGDGFKGIVDITGDKAFMYESGGKGDAVGAEIPTELKGEADKWKRELMETAAESSEELMEKYLETESLSAQEMISGLAAGVKAGEVHPVFCMSAETNIGMKPFLDGLIDFIPAADARAVTAEKPEEEIKSDPAAPRVAYVFKNTSESHVGDMLFVRVFRGTLKSGEDIYNSKRQASERLGQIFCMQGKNRHEVDALEAGDIGAVVKLKTTRIGDTLCEKSSNVELKSTVYPRPSIFSAISGQAKGDEEKIGSGLSRLAEEDPSFEVKVDGEIKQMLISGQGELHLDVIIARLKRRFGVDVLLRKPRIPFKETIKKAGQAQGKYKKQSGGRGQYGDVWLKVEPLPHGGGFEFVNAIVGGVVPSKFIPAVEKGIIGAMADGVIAGYPLVDIKATLYDGSYHTVDSSEQAFKVAGSMGVKKAVLGASPILLEPIYNVEVKVPEEFMGDVMGDLSGRRGKIQGMEPTGRFNIIRSLVPLAELYRYSTHLRSMTQGRGTHKREFDHYEEVPRDIAQKIIEESKKEPEEKK